MSSYILELFYKNIPFDEEIEFNNLYLYINKSGALEYTLEDKTSIKRVIINKNDLELHYDNILLVLSDSTETKALNQEETQALFAVIKKHGYNCNNKNDNLSSEKFKTVFFTDEQISKLKDLIIKNLSNIDTVKNECDFLAIPPHFSEDPYKYICTLGNSPFAYVFTGKQNLYYVDKEKKILTSLIIDLNVYDNLIHKFKIPDNELLEVKFARCLKEKLSLDDLNIITSATKHSHKNKAITVFIGKTGCGKSTTMAYLLGHKMIRRWDEEENKLVVDIENASIDLPVPRISHDTVRSGTIAPITYDHKKSGLSLTDFAGFDHTTSIEERACAYITSEMVIKLAEIRCVAVLIEYSLFDSTRATNLISIFDTLMKIIKHPREINRDSILFLITRIPSDLTAEQCQKSIVHTLNSLKKLHLSKKSYTREEIQLMDIIDLLITNQENILAVNPIDKGETRDAIINKIRKSLFVDKRNFIYGEFDNVQIKFNDFSYIMAQRGIEIIRDKINLPEKISELELLIQHTEEQKQFYTENIKKLEQGEKINFDSLDKELTTGQKVAYEKTKDYLEKTIQEKKKLISTQKDKLLCLDSDEPVEVICHQFDEKRSGFFAKLYWSQLSWTYEGSEISHIRSWVKKSKYQGEDYNDNKCGYFAHSISPLDSKLFEPKDLTTIELNSLCSRENIKNDRNALLYYFSGEEILKVTKSIDKCNFIFTSYMGVDADATIWVYTKKRLKKENQLIISDLKTSIENESKINVELEKQLALVKIDLNFLNGLESSIKTNNVNIAKIFIPKIQEKLNHFISLEIISNRKINRLRKKLKQIICDYEESKIIFTAMESIFQITKPKSVLVNNFLAYVSKLSMLEHERSNVYMDAITLEIFKEPVRSEICNHVFEKESILSYIDSRNGHAACPYCRENISRHILVDDKQLKDKIISDIDKAEKFVMSSKIKQNIDSDQISEYFHNFLQSNSIKNTSPFFLKQQKEELQHIRKLIDDVLKVIDLNLNLDFSDLSKNHKNDFYSFTLFKPVNTPKIYIGKDEIHNSICFEVHETSGYQNLCGINALPVENANQVYDALINYLKTDYLLNDNYSQCCQFLGNDIIQLVSADEPDIQMDSDLQNKLLNLVHIYHKSNNEEDRQTLYKACCEKEICLSYLIDDIQKNNRLSRGVILSWGLISNHNIRIWIKDKDESKICIFDQVKPNLKEGFTEIYYDSVNHFEFMHRVEKETNILAPDL